MGQSLDRVARRLDAIHLGQRRHEPVATRANAGFDLAQLGRPKAERDCHAGRAGQVLRPGSPMSLLRATVLLREDVGSPLDPQGPDPLRALYLVRGQRHQVRAERGHVEREPWCCLDGVDMKQQSAPCVHDLRDLGHRLDRADLVVAEHDRDQHRAIGQRLVDVGRVHAPVPINGHLDDLEPELLEMRQRVTDGMMLDRRGDDPVSPGPPRPRCSLEREVDRLGSAAREHDLAGFAADGRREARVRLVEGLAGHAPEGMRR